MIWLYRLLYLPGLALALPYYLLRMWRRGGYAKDFQHRFGRFRRLGLPAAGKQRIWIQAVSVGEVLAVGPLIRALNQSSHFEIVLTTTTSTGYREARKRYRREIFSVGVFPLDFCLFSHMAWQRIRPDAIVLTESELWPEHLHQASRRDVPAFLINARLSDRSFRRYLRIPSIPAQLLKQFETIFPASETDQQRLIALGAPKERVHAFGNIKLDNPAPETLPESEKTELLDSLGFTAPEDGRIEVILGSSTWPGEEAVLVHLVEELQSCGRDCRLLLVPRHAERGQEIADFLQQKALTWHQRSCGGPPRGPVKIYLADTTGELSQWTRIADLAFIGKSLPPNTGGQSPIDAAGLGVPLIFGNQMNNFRDIAKDLLASGAAREVTDETNLRDAVQIILADEGLRRKMAEAGRQWHQKNRGSSARLAAFIIDALDRPTPASSGPREDQSCGCESPRA